MVFLSPIWPNAHTAMDRTIGAGSKSNFDKVEGTSDSFELPTATRTFRINLSQPILFIGEPEK